MINLIQYMIVAYYTNEEMWIEWMDQKQWKYSLFL